MATATNKNIFKNQSTSCLNCKAKSHLFRLLSNEELNQVNENRCQVKYKAGETIRKQGANLSAVISVTEGLCKMYIEGVESRNVILRLIKPTSFIGGPGLYFDFKHHFTVSAIIDKTVCFIDTKIFKLIMERNTEFANEFIQDMSKNMISIYSRIISLTQKQMAGRVADAIVYFSDDIFESRAFDLPLTKQEIADFTKMSRDNVVRIMKSFDNENIIKQSRHSIEIIDYEKLLRISSTG
ncbi:MAG: Crp/Fnr family transcriptional regulator [Cyclobacteriaceae bacterium]|nr:Crp/Fnr family transcriptional regulator [Cyclobacteriaceae bacterium]